MKTLGWVYAIVLACVGCSFSTAFAERYENAQYGVSVDVPDGWHQFSKSELAQLQSFIDRAGEKSTYVVGFKSTPEGAPPGLPYLLIQFLPNDTHGIRGQITTQAISANYKALFNGQALKSAGSMVKKAGMEMSATTYELQPGLDLDRKRMFYSMEAKSNAGEIKYGAVTHYGRRAAIQCMYYVRDLGELAPGGLPMKTLQSVDLTASERWDPSLESDGSVGSVVSRDATAYKFGRLLGMALGLGLVVAVALVIVRILR